MPMPQAFMELMANIVQSSFSSIMLIGVVAPLTEEFLFRGVILKGLASHTSSKKALLYSTLRYLIHVSLLHVLSRDLTGL